MTKINPLHNRVLVKRDDENQTSKGGIIIPHGSREKPIQGTVLAVGPGRYDKGVFIPTQVKVGDKILMGKSVGVDVTVDDQELVIMRDDEILSTVTLCD